MPFAAGLVLLLLTQGPAAALDTFKLGKETVTAKLPPSAPAHASEIAYKGWNYEYDSRGNLIGRQLGKGGGDELASLYASKAATPAAEWRTKIVLFDDVDIMGETPDGVLHQRRSGYFGPDLHGAMDAIALFGSMVEAYSGGKLKFVPDLEIESESMRFEPPSTMPFNEKFVQDYFGPRINGGTYDAEDKIYRGPYNSVFFLHFGLTDAECQTVVNDTPVSGFSYYFSFDRSRPQILAGRLFNAWVGHLEFAAARHGYPLGRLTVKELPVGTDEVRLRLPQGLITDEMWPAIANRSDTNDFGGHKVAPEAPRAWSKVVADLWSLAPAFEGQNLPSELRDVDRPVVSTVQGGKLLYICEPEYADFVASQMGTPDPLCLGCLATQSGPKIVLQEPDSAGVNRVIVAPSKPDTITDFKVEVPPSRYGGYLTVKSVDDPQQGKATLIEEDWVVRNGWLRLTGPVSGHYLDALVKSVSAAHSITVLGSKGTKTYDIFGSDSVSPESPQSAAVRLDIPNDGSWHDVVIDLSGVGNVLGIYLTPGNSSWWHPSLDQKPAILVAGIEIVDQATATAIATGSSAGPIEQKLQLAASITQSNYAANKAAVLSMLKDPSTDIALNAANVYTRVKDRAAEDQLGELTKSLDSRVAETANRALLAQGTDTGRGLVGLALVNGPFDANRFWAATLLSDQKDPYLAEEFSRLIASNSWQTRIVGARALAEIPGDKAKEFLISFLLDTNPQNELEVARIGPIADDLFMKRMQWYAINDPSDAIRLQCNENMLQTTLPGYDAEGLKGLHDDSWWVRKELLNFIKGHPDEKWRAPIDGALSDANSEVRAAAARALAALPGGANQKETERVNQDKDPRVRMALVPAR
jgi:HEAT repeat protein